MSDKINLCEILKDCPKGTKFYSTIFGYVEFDCIEEGFEHPVVIRNPVYNSRETLTSDGREYKAYDGECTLFPSKEQRIWSEWVCPKKPKFNPKTLQAFDRVLVRDRIDSDWSCDIFSHAHGEMFYCTTLAYFEHVIPYNEETKHLVGTTEEAPEFYRYWED